MEGGQIALQGKLEDLMAGLMRAKVNMTKFVVQSAKDKEAGHEDEADTEKRSEMALQKVKATDEEERKEGRVTRVVCKLQTYR